MFKNITALVLMVGLVSLVGCRRAENKQDEVDATIDAAKLQSGELTPQKFNEQLQGMPEHRRNVYAAYGGQALALSAPQHGRRPRPLRGP